jgi:hypothetical protein
LGKYSNVEETKPVDEIGYQDLLDPDRYPKVSPFLRDFPHGFYANFLPSKHNPINQRIPFILISLMLQEAQFLLPVSLKQEDISKANPRNLYGLLIHPQLQPQQVSTRIPQSKYMH